MNIDIFLNNNKDFFNNNNSSLKKVYILFGPTATGKTNFSVQLAKRIDAEIINCDMAQIYWRGKIGTGQIKEEEKEGVIHYLFGFLDTPLSISVYEMRRMIEFFISLILAKNKNVIIVGGSSFCVYSLFFAPSSFYKNNDESYNLSLFNNSHSMVFSNSDKLYKDQIVFFPKYYYIVIFIDFYHEKKDIWLSYVKKRIANFFAEGWLEEIEGMRNDWSEFLFKKKIIGYYELIPYVKKNSLFNLNQIIDLIYFSTCQYGKKQRTFLRKMKRDFTQYLIPYIEYYF